MKLIGCDLPSRPKNPETKIDKKEDINTMAIGKACYRAESTLDTQSLKIKEIYCD